MKISQEPLEFEFNFQNQHLAERPEIEEPPNENFGTTPDEPNKQSDKDVDSCQPLPGHHLRTGSIPSPASILERTAEHESTDGADGGEGQTSPDQASDASHPDQPATTHSDEFPVGGSHNDPPTRNLNVAENPIPRISHRNCYCLVAKDLINPRLNNPIPRTRAFGQFHDSSELASDARICHFHGVENRKLLLTVWIACLAVRGWLFDRVVETATGGMEKKKRKRGVVTQSALEIVQAWQGEHTARSAQMYVSTGCWIIGKVTGCDCQTSTQFLARFVEDEQFRLGANRVTLGKIARTLDQLEAARDEKLTFSSLRPRSKTKPNNDLKLDGKKAWQIAHYLFVSDYKELSRFAELRMSQVPELKRAAVLRHLKKFLTKALRRTFVSPSRPRPGSATPKV